MNWVLDLFAGTGSATDPFVDEGWGRVRVENNPSFEAEIHGDILEMTASDITWERARHVDAPCHEPAPRGAKTGTQGLSKTEAGMLPYALGQELCTEIENALANRLYTK